MTVTGMDSQTAAREKAKAERAKAKREKQRRRTETITEAATFAAMFGKDEAADADFKSRRRNEKQKALGLQREELGVALSERLIKRLDREEAEEEAEAKEVETSAENSTTSSPEESQVALPDEEGSGSPDSAAEQEKAPTPPSEPFSKSLGTIDAVLNSDPKLLTHDQVKRARECAGIEEQQATNRKVNADAQVVEQRAAKIEAEAKKINAEAEEAEAEARKADAEAASETTRQRILRAGEIIALVMQVVITVVAVGIIVTGMLTNPLLIPSGVALGGGAFGIKQWWGKRKAEVRCAARTEP